jgi:adenosyl cobinamide kinase/adenosyl cobinamide phosphate guanylyltransferase
MPENKKIIYEIDKWILALIQAGFDGERLADRLAAFKERFAGTDSVIICNDISCGVVPTDYKLRMWRETVGRTLADLAKMADEAVRLFCGIPTKIK